VVSFDMLDSVRVLSRVSAALILKPEGKMVEYMSTWVQ
jgi:hypothetical protein